jgi:hypothetical protein
MTHFNHPYLNIFLNFLPSNPDILNVKRVKGFFSTSYFTKEEFWNHFDQKKYNKLRETYHAENNFMDIYEKIVYRSGETETKQTFRGKLFTFFGKKYLKHIKKNSKYLII